MDITELPAASRGNVMLCQTLNGTLVSGTNYTISFTAKADAAKTIDVVLYSSSNTSLWSTSTPLTTTANNFSYTYTPSANQTGAYLALRVGQENVDCYFDNVSVTTTPSIILTNCVFGSGTSPWTTVFSNAPAPTLYHWDLPQTLQDEGGWSNRRTAKLFADYADKCFKELGDKVGMWMTLNEPSCITNLGHEIGIHAPGIKDIKVALRVVHHLNLAHGLSVQAFRASGCNGEIGLAANPPALRPASDKPEDIEATERALDKSGRIYLNPMYGKGYPKRCQSLYPDATLPIEEGDLKIIAQPVDFLGLNMYAEGVVKHAPSTVSGFKYVKTNLPKTDMGWDITPDGIYRFLKWVDAEYGHPKIYITENGCAFRDVISSDNRCHDGQRVEFIKSYLAACLKARNEGVNLRGYFMWSFIDNFEWSFGYSKRFGIVYCDYADNLRRIPKDSYYYYQKVVSSGKV